MNAKDDRNRFGGNGNAAMERDGFRCQDCGVTTDLIVHHMERKGLLFPNNDISNLVTLCRACHTRRHEKEDAAERNALKSHGTQAMGFDRLSARSRKASATMGPAGLSERSRKRWENMSPEQRAACNAKKSETLKASAAARLSKGWETRRRRAAEAKGPEGSRVEEIHA
jgi:hypothetical protein